MLSVLVSCNKSEFEDVFNGENSDAIAPDVLWDHYDDSSVLFEPSEKSKHYLEHYIISMVNGGQWRDTAFVVNSVAELPDYVMDEATVKYVGDIDFGANSLIIGLYGVVASNQSITLQRVVAKQDGIDIYNKIESIGFGMQAPFYKYYVSIYPKLPSTVVRSRNWHVPIPEFK